MISYFALADLSFSELLDRSREETITPRFVVSADRHGCMNPSSLEPQMLGFALPHHTPLSFVAGSKCRAVLVDPAVTLLHSFRLSLVCESNASSAYMTALLLSEITPAGLCC